MGCTQADPQGRVPVTGEVVVDGEPLSAGAISLESTSAAQGTAAGARIRDGGFSIERAKGPSPGSYRVRIFASGRVQAPVPKGGSERTHRPMIERIPADYNTKSNRTVDVTAEGPNHFRFEITSTPP